MYLDERGYLVLKTIVNNPSITGKEVEQSLDLSRKQVSYTMGSKTVPMCTLIKNGEL